MARSDTPKIEQVALARLVRDFTIYPRNESGVSSHHVKTLADSIEAGDKLPPIIVEAGTFRITDGFHRFEAYMRVFGDDALVDVEPHVYASDAEALEDATRRNSIHGRGLNEIDRRRVVIMLTQAGRSDGIIARALSIPEPRVQQLRVLVAYTQIKVPTATVVHGRTREPIVLKAPLAHLAGQQLTEEQVQAVGRAPGTNYTLLAKQLTDALRYGFIDELKPGLQKSLDELREALNEYLAAHLAA